MNVTDNFEPVTLLTRDVWRKWAWWFMWLIGCPRR